MPGAALSGARALARGAIEAGVSLVTGYPGAPATAVVNSILEQTASERVRVEWTSNEKVALEMAFGASVAGIRALLCVKGVGLNIALDPLMALNLSGCNAGLVILVGDDPGGWGSQNEQDSRILALAAQIPLLEPTSVSDARIAMYQAFQLSEETGLPVMVRITRALVLAEVRASELPALLRPTPPPSFRREYMRWMVLPVNVVPYHHRLLQRLDGVQARFERSPLNDVAGDSLHSQGVIAAGFTHQKLADLPDGAVPPGTPILRLGTFHPLPVGQVTAFLRTVEAALVLEETTPLVERAVRAVAQSAGLTLPIYGRDTGHVPRAGELFAPHIADALEQLQRPSASERRGVLQDEGERPRPSRQPLCDGCPYIPTFDALIEVIEELGGRGEVVVIGDPGCMVRAQLPPYRLMDVKNSLGSSIGMATGVSLGLEQRGERKRVVALVGDSSFLHSGFAGLVDAARVGATMMVLLLDNGTTALSGGQPHPASQADARGGPQRGVDLAALARDAGAEEVLVVDLDRGEGIRPAIERGMNTDGVAVVIARGRCPRWVAGEV
jgi:indolepyruvate ferredoxin oxidoreductase alpha subunit